MWRLTVISLVLMGLASGSAIACSFAPGFERFEPDEATAWETWSRPRTSTMSVRSLNRGHDDGNFASCSDAGVLTIAIDQPEFAPELGYIFEIESGGFPDKVFPDAIIAPRELGDGSWGFFFVWLDLPAGRKIAPPIDAVVSVRAVSPTLDLGEKIYVSVRSP